MRSAWQKFPGGQDSAEDALLHILDKVEGLLKPAYMLYTFDQKRHFLFREHETLLKLFSAFAKSVDHIVKSIRKSFENVVDNKIANYGIRDFPTDPDSRSVSTVT